MRTECECISSNCSELVVTFLMQEKNCIVSRWRCKERKTLRTYSGPLKLWIFIDDTNRAHSSFVKDCHEKIFSSAIYIFGQNIFHIATTLIRFRVVMDGFFLLCVCVCVLGCPCYENGFSAWNMYIEACLRLECVQVHKSPLAPL